MDSILSMIKQGVKLRPTDKDDKRSSQDLDILETPSDSHMRLLQESLSRISKFTRERSPESEDDSEDEDLFAWVIGFVWRSLALVTQELLLESFSCNISKHIGESSPLLIQGLFCLISGYSVAISKIH